MFHLSGAKTVVFNGFWRIFILHFARPLVMLCASLRFDACFSSKGVSNKLEIFLGHYCKFSFLVFSANSVELGA